MSGNLPSLLSIEVLISHVQVDPPTQCHLPCMVFRLLDYPAVSIPYFDQWQLEEFHNLKKKHPHLSWGQLRPTTAKLAFNRGKSCLLKIEFKTFYGHLLQVPLFLLLTDQINESNAKASQFLGSGNVKLNELIEVMSQSIGRHGKDVPLVEQQTFHCTLFNLMGVKIGSSDIAVRLCHYGTTILAQLPALNDGAVTRRESTAALKATAEPVRMSAEAVVQPIQFVNEKRDVGLQLSHRELSSTTRDTKSIQTRWTSSDQRRQSPRMRSIVDPTLDDPTIAFYRPPALYFNSDSDFLHVTTPAASKSTQQAKTTRLKYLASIPIASFDGTTTPEQADDEESQEKPTVDTRSNAPAPIKQPVLTKDFLQCFPLLRSLVEEALALHQQYDYHIPLSAERVTTSARAHSTIARTLKPVKQTPARPKSAPKPRVMSVIIPRGLNRSRRTGPPLSKATTPVLTKHPVQKPPERLSTPTTTNNRSKPLVKPVAPSPKSVTAKPPLTYATTRAHRLMAEYSRARRTGFQPQATSSPKAPLTSKKAVIPSSSPSVLNASALSQGSLLNKVEMDTITAGNLHRTVKSISTTSPDATPRMNQTLAKTISTEQNDKNDLAFSITDITDFFTDGDESSARPDSRQSA